MTGRSSRDKLLVRTDRTAGTTRSNCPTAGGPCVSLTEDTPNWVFTPDVLPNPTVPLVASGAAAFPTWVNTTTNFRALPYMHN